MAVPDEDDSCISRYRSGDLSAFQALYARYRSRLYAYIRRSVSDPDTSDELFQDVWVRVLARLDRYEHRGRFRSWLFSCAHNIIVDYYRKADRNLEDQVDAEAEGVTAGPGRASDPDNELGRRIDAALRELPFEQRQAFYLREVLSCSIRDIGEIQECSTEAARSRLRYAYSKLQDRLADLDE